jgi:protein-disulfide isomerase
VEYGDYQCPYCGEAYPVVKAVQKKLGKRLRFVFRNMPLNEVHEYAEVAAEAAEAADAQGKFWPMHDALYEHQADFGPGFVARLAKRVGLDVAAVEAAVAARTFRQRVRKDFMSGVRSGVSGTPTFYVNGARFEGDWQSPEALIAALEASSPGA